MTTTTTTGAGTWWQTPAPRGAGLMTFDCLFCGHQELGRPIHLTNGTTTATAGTGCAAIAIYGAATAHTRRKVTTEAESLAIIAARDEAARAERRDTYTAALAAFRAGLDAQPELIRARSTYFATVRGPWQGAHLQTFPAFLADIATTGNLPA